MKYFAMLINLHKSFRFANAENNFQVDYVFQQDIAERKDAGGNTISLFITSCRNAEAERTDKIGNASSILSKSNEQIQKIIEERILSFKNAEALNPPSKGITVEELI
jgi:hypothetical protein